MRIISDADASKTGSEYGPQVRQRKMDTCGLLALKRVSAVESCATRLNHDLSRSPKIDETIALIRCAQCATCPIVNRIAPPTSLADGDCQ
jgi:hypothetical protein